MNSEPTSYRVLTTDAHKHGPGLVIGHVTLQRDGWRFIPQYQGKTSRKGHTSPERALKGRVWYYKLDAVRPDNHCPERVRA